MDEMEYFNNVFKFGQSFYQSCDLGICILSKFYQNLRNKNRPRQEPTRLDLYKSTNCANADKIKSIQLRCLSDVTDSNGAGEI